MLARACVTHSIVKLCVAIITILLHTVMLMSSILLGSKLRDSLYIELNGLKMNQLFGISRLILRWCLMLMLNTALATQSWEEDIRNKNCLFFLYATTHQKGENEFLIYIIFMLNDWRERHPMMVEIPHRVMCGQIKNTNNIQTCIKIMINPLICLWNGDQGTYLPILRIWSILIRLYVLILNLLIVS